MAGKVYLVTVYSQNTRTGAWDRDICTLLARSPAGAIRQALRIGARGPDMAPRGAWVVRTVTCHPRDEGYTPPPAPGASVWY